MTKPFVKWAGGKMRLSKKIIEMFPSEYNDYYEPFVGGGAVGLSLCNTNTKHFSDINSKLICCYNVIKYRYMDLIQELSKNIYRNDKESFLSIRDIFNKDKQIDEVVSSAMFIYLNKCCFNGLYRENGSGNFNVPFGSMKNPTICDSVLLKNVSEYLMNVEVTCNRYLDILPKKGDLVYFDPPYHGTFSTYTKSGFDENDHMELRDFVDKLSLDGVRVVLSNSNSPYIQELYKNYNKTVVNARYSIGVNRQLVEEVVITNFN